MRESQGEKHFEFGHLWCPQKSILLLLRWICMLVARCMIGISSANLVRKITKTNGCRCHHPLHPPPLRPVTIVSYHQHLHQDQCHWSSFLSSSLTHQAPLSSFQSPSLTPGIQSSSQTWQAPSRSYIAGATFMHERNSQIAILSLCQVIFNHYHCPLTCQHNCSGNDSILSFKNQTFKYPSVR